MGSVRFELERVVPKARPRGNANGCYYLPERYRLWREETAVILRQQMPVGFQGYDTPVSVSIRCYGKWRGDADNIAGAILDALVDVQVLPNDSLNYVQQLSFGVVPEKKKNKRLIIEIKPLA